MISARAVLDEGGAIARFEASGHAMRGGLGNNLVCAAFTVLARTAYESLSALPGWELDVEAPEPGVLRFRTRLRGQGGAERAAGLTDFLLAGISGLEREYPGELRLTIERNWRE